MKNYEIDACECYSNTAAYLEYQQKTKNYTKEKWTTASDGLMAIFAEFSVLNNGGAFCLMATLQSTSTTGPR